MDTGRPAKPHPSLLLPPLRELCSHAQGILPSCAALSADGSSVSAEAFRVDKWIGQRPVCISNTPRDAALLKSLATRIIKSRLSPLCGCYPPALGRHLGAPGRCRGIWVMAAPPWCLAFQLRLLGSGAVGRKLQSAATPWRRGARQWGGQPGAFCGRK